MLTAGGRFQSPGAAAGASSARSLEEQTGSTWRTCCRDSPGAQPGLEQRRQQRPGQWDVPVGWQHLGPGPLLAALPSSPAGGPPNLAMVPGELGHGPGGPWGAELARGEPPGTELAQGGPQGAELAQGEPQGAELAEGGPWGAEEEEDEASMDCVICFSPYDRLFKVPKALACGHTFCLECLARINVSSEQVNAVSCPVCRELTRLPPRKGLPGLPTRQELLDRLPLAPAGPGSSVRFSRRRGLLYVPGWGTRKGRAPALPKPGTALSTVSLSVDVGRPAPRSLGRGPQGLGCSSWPFAVAVAIAVAVTVGLVICGVYIFFLLPGSYGLGPGLILVPSNGTRPNGTNAPAPPRDRRTLTPHREAPPPQTHTMKPPGN